MTERCFVPTIQAHLYAHLAQLSASYDICSRRPDMIVLSYIVESIIACLYYSAPSHTNTPVV